MFYRSFNILKIFLIIPFFLFSLVCFRANKGYADKITLGSSDQLIVLLHGLEGKADHFSRLQKNLKEAFPNATIVALNSLEGDEDIQDYKMPRTLIYPISKQAELSFQELSKKIPNLTGKSILFIGHSQGGLRAYELYNQFKDKLNVKGIMTLATPWEGAPGLKVDERLFNQLLPSNNAVQSDIQRLCKNLSISPFEFNCRLIREYKHYQSAGKMPGGKDLIPNSGFLSRVKHALSNETIPILAVGAGQSDFGALLDKDVTPSFKVLNDMYAELIVGKTYDTKGHDMLVPVGSQHGYNVFPQEKQNFKRVFIADASHNGFVLGYPIAQSKSILDHNDMVKAVIGFSKKIFEAHQSPTAAAA